MRICSYLIELFGNYLGVRSSWLNGGPRRAWRYLVIGCMHAHCWPQPVQSLSQNTDSTVNQALLA